MSFTQPMLLLLAVPLALALFAWPLRSRIALALRITVTALLLLALAGLTITLPSRDGMVVVVADRSRSMPADATEQELSAVRALEAKRPSASGLSVVSFGRRAAVEPNASHLANFASDVGPDASDLSSGITTALSLIPAGSPGRIVVMSDGRWSGDDPAAAAALSAARDIPIDIRPLSRSAAGDSAILRVDVPERVTPGEAFLINVWLQSPIHQPLQVALRRKGTVQATQRIDAPSGLSRVTFRDRAESEALLSYEVELVTQSRDPQPENDRAKFLIAVEGPKRLLLVTANPASRFAALLRAGSIEVEPRDPSTIEWSLATLGAYSAVIVENVPAEQIGRGGMETLAAWVRNAGGGLFLSGGQSSFGPGGYFRSPLDEILPVSMEMRQEQRKLNLAMVVTMDRSGSMAMPAGGGSKTKMDLADLSAVQVLDLLSPNDEFGVMAVDSQAHVVADLAPVSAHGPSRKKILSVESMGGGIFIYEALSNAARMLLSARSATKHILLLADAADSEEPGDYKALLERCRQANITVSVVGLGTDKDSDAELLRDIAKRGGGSIYFTNDAHDLPRVFAQDTFMVARSSFVDQPTGVKTTSGASLLSGRGFSAAPSIGGYNLTYLRPKANQAMLTLDEWHAPVAAAWQVGLGRVVAYTGEVDGKFTGAIGTWSDIGSFLTSLTRWSAGENRSSSALFASRSVEHGGVTLQLDLDPERDDRAVTRTPIVHLVHGRAGSKPESEERSMEWSSANSLRLHVPLDGSETLLPSIVVEGTQLRLPPAMLPYSPEFKPPEPGEGVSKLQQMARVSGGRQRAVIDEIWKDLKPAPRSIELRPWLILAAMLMLLLEVVERRMALLAAWQLPFERGTAAVAATVRRRRTVREEQVPARAKATVTPHPDTPQQPEKPPAPEAPLLDALKQARDRAKRRG